MNIALSKSTAKMPEAPAQERESCLHCGLNLPSHRQHEAFCCSGCRAVYHLLQDQDLTQFYDLRKGSGVPATPRDENLDWLAPLLVQNTSDSGAQNLSLSVQGIHCAGCVWLLRETFRKHAGGTDIRINPTRGRVDLSWDSTQGAVQDWIQELAGFGYHLGPLGSGSSQQLRPLALRLGISAGIAAQVMMFSLAFHLGLGADGGSIYNVLGWTNFILAILALTIGGSFFITKAFYGLRRGVASMDLPIAIGILLTFTASTWAYFRFGPEEAYFDSVCIFIALMLTGRWVQERMLERNRASLRDDPGLEHLVARRQKADSSLEMVPVTELQEGDRVMVVPGDLFPVRAEIEHDATISLDWINGESAPKTEPAQSVVPAGAFNVGSEAIAAISKEDFKNSGLTELLSEATQTADSGQGSWARLSQIYVLAVLSLSILGFWLYLNDGVEAATKTAVSILVITCPCAIGLAIPLAAEMVLHRLRQRGVFVRSADFLDRAFGIRQVVFDKTGTLTLGRLDITEDTKLALSGLTADQRAVLATMTSFSNHPKSRAIHRAIDEPTLPLNSIRVSEFPGSGPLLAHDGKTYRFGHGAFALDDDRGGSAETVFSMDRERLLNVSFEESLKVDAVHAIDLLRNQNMVTYLLSGDHEEKVQEAAERLGIPKTRQFGAMKPEDKARWVREINDKNTLMVGDGINDAPGFAEAHCTATPAIDQPFLPARADFYLLGDRLSGISLALHAAKRFRQLVTGSLITFVAYNVVAITLCFMGLVNPLAAAILMPLSSLAVLSITLFRLRENTYPWKLSF
ncbi:MAG: HAD-IC family P-type ATPase [Candidatus Eisenbacteria bacterium]|uniref:HAD-IC family P-type ATPase n=1 Tax=Eiseniibacteriota bacterium TaxID=2212470 RepID=A0A7Y2EB28_UNCEI|nr:HAD-IC family P-type ATPase [Candidatus Eisenbacteria bacterium]